MIFNYLIIAGFVVALGYYIYRQQVTPGSMLFFANRLKEEGKRPKRNRRAEPAGKAEPYPGQGPVE